MSSESTQPAHQFPPGARPGSRYLRDALGRLLVLHESGLAEDGWGTWHATLRLHRLATGVAGEPGARPKGLTAHAAARLQPIDELSATVALELWVHPDERAQPVYDFMIDAMAAGPLLRAGRSLMLGIVAYNLGATPRAQGGGYRYGSFTLRVEGGGGRAPLGQPAIFTEVAEPAAATMALEAQRR